MPAGRHTVEFRHPSWFAPEVLARLAERDVALTVGDHPERRFQLHEATADWMFVRFHHGTRGRRGNYSDAELEQWARRMQRWLGEHTVFAYFNNDWEGFAPANAIELRRRLS